MSTHFVKSMLNPDEPKKYIQNQGKSTD